MIKIVIIATDHLNLHIVLRKIYYNPYLRFSDRHHRHHSNQTHPVLFLRRPLRLRMTCYQIWSTWSSCVFLLKMKICGNFSFSTTSISWSTWTLPPCSPPLQLVEEFHSSLTATRPTEKRFWDSTCPRPSQRPRPRPRPRTRMNMLMVRTWISAKLDRRRSLVFPLFGLVVVCSKVLTNVACHNRDTATTVVINMLMWKMGEICIPFLLQRQDHLTELN